MPEQTEQPQQLESLPAWDEVAPRFEQAYPDLNPDVMRGQYEQARRMRESRRRLLGADEDRLAWWARRAAPIGSAVGNLRRSVAYGQAQQRMQAGQPQPEDYDLIAAYEELQVQDREASLGRQIGSGLASIPAVLGEGMLAGAAVRGLAGAAPRALGWMAPRQAGAGQLANIAARATGRVPGEATSLLGQAVTTTARAIPTAAAMPSMYLDQAAQANIAAGRDPLDIRGLPPAFAVGAMQTAVLGSLANYANNVPGTSLRAYLQRAATRTGAGVAEQAGVDVLAGMTGLQSGYGLVGDLVDVAQGRPHAAEHALRHAVVQAATFAAFAGLHEAHGRDAVRDRFLETTRELRRQGMSQARAAEMVEGVHQGLNRIIQEGWNQTEQRDATGHTRVAVRGLHADPAEVEAYIGSLPETGPLRPYAEQLVSSVLRPMETGRPIQTEPAGHEPGIDRPVAQEAAPPRPEPQAVQQAATAPPEATQARPEAPTPVRPLVPSPEAMSEALDRPQLPGHEVTPLTDAQARAAAAEFLRRSPTGSERSALEMLQPETANVAEPREREVERPAQPPHPLAPVVEAAFPGAQPTRRPGELRAEVGGRTVYTEFDAGRNVMRVDFEAERPGVGAELRRGSIDLARGLRSLAEGLHAQGVGVEYRAIDTNRGQFRSPRADIYKKILEKAGFEQVGGPGVNKAPLYEFRPRQEQASHEVAPPRPAEVAPPVERPSRERGRPEVAPPTEQQRAAEMGRLAAQQGEEIAREERSGTGRMPEQSRVIAGEGEVPAELDRKLQEGNLTRGQLDTMRDVLRGMSFAEAGKLAGMSGEGARKRVKSALKRLKGNDPDFWEKINIPEDVMNRIAREGLSHLARRTAEIGPEGQVEDVFARGEREPAMLAETRGIERLGFSEEQTAQAERVAEAVRSAEASGQDPADFVAREMPELAQRLGPQGVKELVRVVTEEMAFAREEVSNENRTLRSAGEQPLSPEEAASVEAEARQQVIAEAGTQAPGGPADAGAAAGNLRRAAAAGPGGPGGQPRKREVEPGEYAPGTGTARAASAPGRGEPVDRIEQLAQGIAQEEAGHLDPQAIREYAATTASRLRENYRAMSKWFKELFGAAAPRTMEISEASGNAISNHNAASTAARLAAPEFIDQVLGKMSPAMRKVQGSVYNELHLRWMRLANRKEAARASAEASEARRQRDTARATEKAKEASDYMNRALAVGTLVGGERSVLKGEQQFQTFIENNPLRTPEDFERALNSHLLRDTTTNWRRHMVPEMERNFHAAEGTEHDDPINDYTQIPEFPMNMRAVREGEEVTDGAAFTRPSQSGGGRGNLRNVRLSKLGFSRRATGAAEGYENDLAAMIEHSLYHGYEAASRNVMVRTLLETGTAVRGRPGERPTLADEPTRKIDFVFRQEPKWADPADAGKENLYVRERAYDEVRRSFAPDEPTKFEALRNGMGIITRGTLAGLGELAAHVKNMGTFFFRPGVSFGDFAESAYGYLKGSPEVSKRIVELAKMDAMKDRAGPESGVLWGGKYDPTHWMGRFIDFMQVSMRLTADKAFDKLAESGGWFGGEGAIKGTEANRRDFINQLGHYTKRGQNRLVAWLRDTGIGPFATAGTNYFAQGLRSLTMSPGVKTTSWRAEVGLRAEMLARTALFVSLAPIANYFLSGRADGDDNTPFGAIYVGRTAEGRSAYIDLLALTGIPRGARAVGLEALRRGVQSGQTPGQILDRSVWDAAASISQPGVGPGVQFIHTAISGEGHRGQRVAEHPGPGGSEFLSRLGAAASMANPLIAAATGAGHPGRQVEVSERVAGLFGPFGPRYRSEVNQLQDRYFALEEQRRQWEEQRRHGQVFPQEAQYARLRAFIEAARQLEDATQGIGGHGGARGQGPAPSPEQVIRLRIQRVQVARQALGLPQLQR